MRRWAGALLQLLQLTLSAVDRETVAATVYAFSSMPPFVDYVQQHSDAYKLLASAAAAAVQVGNR